MLPPPPWHPLVITTPPSVDPPVHDDLHHDIHPVGGTAVEFWKLGFFNSSTEGWFMFTAEISSRKTLPELLFWNPNTNKCFDFVAVKLYVKGSHEFVLATLVKLPNSDGKHPVATQKNNQACLSDDDEVLKNCQKYRTRLVQGVMIRYLFEIFLNNYANL